MKGISQALALLLLMALPGNARAQEDEVGCRTDNTSMKCPLELCLALQSVVITACKSDPPPTGCKYIAGCEALKAMRARWEACLSARLKVMECFQPVHAGHSAQVEQIKTVILKCDAKIARPKPEGCAELCP